MHLSKRLQLDLLIPALALSIAGSSLAEQGDDNPTGVNGAYNGNVATGCSYDPYTGNALREIDDIVVPGAIGAYPLKWTRYFNSHCTADTTATGGHWRFSYIDYAYPFSRNSAYFPEGPVLNFQNPIYGVEDYVENPYDPQ